MTVLDFFCDSPIWVKVIMVILFLYVITWLPRVISGFNKIIRNLVELNKNIDTMNTLLRENVKQGNGSRISADLMAKLLLKKQEEKEKKE